MFEIGALSLAGHGVELRPLSLEDAPGLARAAAEDRKSYAYTPVPDGEPASVEYVQRALDARAQGQRYPFAILFGGRIVGSTSYADYQPWRWPKAFEAEQRTTPDAVEVGYTWLAASAQRTPCNTAAKLLLFTHAFEAWRVRRVCLKTDARNRRSRAAIERVGARFEGVLRADRPGWDGQVRDTAFFSILAREWPDVQAALQSRLASAGSR